MPRANDRMVREFLVANMWSGIALAEALGALTRGEQVK